MDGAFWDGQRVLVMGGGGFVGRWAARSVATTGAEVFVADGEGVTPGEVFIERPTVDASCFAVDVLDVEAVVGLVMSCRPTVVLHFGGLGCGGVGMSGAHELPREAFARGVRGTMHVLEAMRSWNDSEAAGLLSAVHVCSGRVYGVQGRASVPESSPLNARGMGEAFEACGDVLARAYADSYGLPLAVARLSAVFGGDEGEERGLVGECVVRALDGEPPLLRGSGLDATGFLHVDDAVRGVMMLAERAAEDAEIAGSAFNFGPDEPITVLELARRVVRRAGRPDLDPIVSNPCACGMTEHLDSTDAKRLLGWRALMGLDEGIEEALTWYAARARAA